MMLNDDGMTWTAISSAVARSELRSDLAVGTPRGMGGLGERSIRGRARMRGESAQQDHRGG